MKPYMDARTAPLNPCSVESIPEPVTLADRRRVWPVAVSCYELQQGESSNTNTSTCSTITSEQRVGHLELQLIEVPDIVHEVRCMPLQFEQEPYSVLQASTSSGILDGKWSAMPTGGAGTPSGNSNPQSWFFASAHSTGEIRIHSFVVRQDVEVDDENPTNRPLFTCDFMGQSEPPIPAATTITVDDNETVAASPPLCLSLAWDSAAAYKRSTTESTIGDLPRIVSTYSDGRVAIHDVAFVRELDGENDNATTPTTSTELSAQLIPRDCWKAHSLFQKSPAEVWSACFVGRDTVWSGGDEGQLKAWDIRAPLRPTQVVRDAFGAGVTCLSPHPKMETVVAVGSYDETICLFDTRYVNEQRPLFRTKPLGGGIWRIKWHPYSPDRMLVGAMHGGCRILNFGGGCFSTNSGSNHNYNTLGNHIPNTLSFEEALQDGRIASKCTKHFAEHESMAYGADWLVCPHPTQNGYFEAAASCSFYDRAVFLWDSVF